VKPAPSVSRNGFGDWQFLVKYRIAAGNAEHGNYILHDLSQLRWGLCISLLETDSQDRRSIVRRSDRSQILFRYGMRWKTLTRAGYVPTAAALLLARPFLLLLWLAMGALPAWPKRERAFPAW
jgi:hypothetical protein